MKLVRIESLDREGRGVAHVDGKVVFIDGAITGETVEYEISRSRPSFDTARLVAIRRPAAARVVPRCLYFGVCGGCSLQHVDHPAQVAAKQRVLEDALWHVGQVKAAEILAPIHGSPWGYRSRARLSVRLVPRKGGVLVGFHEKKSSYVADMRRCEILPPHVSDALPDLRELIGALSVRARLPQLEVAVGEQASVLVLRVLDPPNGEDEALMKRFAERTGLRLWLQPGGPQSAAAFWPQIQAPLRYSLREFAVGVEFGPVDFTQINQPVNEMLVRRAVAMLEPRAGERIADYFCGLGNFSLPLASLGAQVAGYEAAAPLVRRASLNAECNGLAARCRFAAVDLFDRDAVSRLPVADKALLDPPREGAVELVRSFAAQGPRRIVYVSCDPATLARDAAVLVRTQGYRLAAAGVANMFPHTSHVESIALFERD